MASECFADFDVKTDAWHCSFPSGKVADEVVGDEEMNYMAATRRIDNATSNNQMAKEVM